VAPAATQTQAEQPVTFSFGGAIIEMKASPDLPRATGGPVRRSRPANEGLTPAQSAILSFIVIAVLLGLALYFITR
jgi:hypothetical protein